jgi:hypothetical protein
MIKISSFLVNDRATRVYADYVEKVAFPIGADAGLIMGSIAAGLTMNHFSRKAKEQQQQQNAQPSPSIENGAYTQIENMLRDLKIVFTPISVIYSVNGQVFEIISTEEMNAYMRQAFIQKDANYFRDLLLNKINMETQLAEQAFAQRLLTANGVGEQQKQANFLEKQEYLLKLSEEESDVLVKKASQGLDGVKITIDPTFDSLRPFDHSITFCNPRELEKVAGIFELFQGDQVQDVGVHQLNSQVNVGFLPDRVVFLWNGQLIDQLTLLHMNEEGFEAFRNRDKPFFIDLFKQYTKEVTEGLQESPSEPNHIEAPEEETHEASVSDILERLEKTAEGFEDILDDFTPVIERDHIELFEDPDIHPIVYDKVLSHKYSNSWHRHEMESIMKQIEEDFHLSKGIEENPLNKLSIIHAISNPDHAMYTSPFTFEKYMRGMNSKSVLFEDFQGNLSFEEIMFGLELAKLYNGEEVFFEFHSNVAAYVAEEIMNDGVRFVSNVLYDETNPSENDFFRTVNDLLMRKWKEEDSLGYRDNEGVRHRHTLTEQIVEIADDILKHYNSLLDVADPYNSTRNILRSENLLDVVSSQDQTSVRNMVVQNVVAHVTTSLFLDYKREEYEHSISLLQKEGVLNG